MFNSKNKPRKKTLFELEEEYEKGQGRAQYDLEDPISDHDGAAGHHSPWENIQEEYMRLKKTCV